MPKILVVDDSNFQRERVKKIVNTLGYEVTTAANGEEALREVETNQFSLIITDLHMPGLNGFELLTRLKEKNCQVPVIVLSADVQVEIISEVKKLGAAGYFSKPVNEENLTAYIKRLQAA